MTHMNYMDWCCLCTWFLLLCDWCELEAACPTLSVWLQSDGQGLTIQCNKDTFFVGNQILSPWIYLILEIIGAMLIQLHLDRGARSSFGL